MKQQSLRAEIHPAEVHPAEVHPAEVHPAEVHPESQTAELDLVIPFTTPDLTRAAVKLAERLGPGLHAAIRLLKIQVVPFPLQESPVQLAFLREQLESFESELPLSATILLTRDYETDLMRSLRPESIVVLASKRRLWRTRTESLAAALRRAGHRVVLCHTSDEKKELKNA